MDSFAEVMQIRERQGETNGEHTERLRVLFFALHTLSSCFVSMSQTRRYEHARSNERASARLSRPAGAQRTVSLSKSMLLSQARVPVGPSGPGLIMSDIQVMIPPSGEARRQDSF